MRRIKRSATVTEEFQTLLAQGVPKFGYRLVAQKRDLVEEFVKSFLVDFPGGGGMDEDIGLHTYHVARTPSVLAYDFDDTELRLHLIFYEHADRTQIDPKNVVW